jgi:hypothetical protein
MFRPPVTTAQLRDLIRYRKALINENTARVTRIRKVLQDSGIKPATCAADVMSVSGRADSASTTVPVERMPDHVEAQEADIAAVDERIEAALAQFVGQVELLTAIPGSITAPRRSSSPASAPTWPPFPPPGTWRRGLGCARANATLPAGPGSGKTRKGSTWVTRSPGPVRQRGLTHQGHLLSERYRQGRAPPQ